MADRAESNLRLGALLMTIAGIGFIGYAAIFVYMNFFGGFLELGIGPSQVDKNRDEIEAFSPSLYQYISHLHVAVAAFIAATGLAVVGLSWFGVRRGMRWAWGYAVASPVLGLLVALPLHYVYGLATLGHLGLIYLATLVFVAGALLSLLGLRAMRVPASSAP